MVCTKAFFISQPIVVKRRIQIGDNIIHNRTASCQNCDRVLGLWRTKTNPDTDSQQLVAVMQS